MNRPVIVEEDLTYRIFADLKRDCEKTTDFDEALRQLGITVRGKVSRSAMVEAYNRAVLKDGLLPIELLDLTDKNNLKEMARKYSDKEHGFDYCKILHLFIFWYEKQLEKTEV